MISLKRCSASFSHQTLHSTELANVVDVLRVEEHDVFLLQLLNAVDVVRRHVLDIGVDENGHLAPEFVQLLDCPLQRVESFQDHLRMHLLTDFHHDAQLVERVRGQQVWLQLEQTLQEKPESADRFKLDRHYFKRSLELFLVCLVEGSVRGRAAHFILTLLLFDRLERHNVVRLRGACKPCFLHRLV